MKNEKVEAFLNKKRRQFLLGSSFGILKTKNEKSLYRECFGKSHIQKNSFWWGYAAGAWSCAGFLALLLVLVEVLL